MRRANKMCKGCPFRGKVSKRERVELAAIPDDWFPCHEEAGYSSTDIQCRGHWELKRQAARTIMPAEPGKQDKPRPTDAARGGYARQHRKVWEGPGRLRCKVAEPIRRVHPASATAGMSISTTNT